MSTPIIGITTYGQDADGQVRLPRDYVDAVRRAGGVPVLVPPGETSVQRLLAGLDGLILAGGGDIDPACYGGCRHETIYNLDVERDQAELSLVRAALERKLPTLGICRGAQVINVALGGTLIEHLPDIVGEQTLHRLPPRQPAEHAITVTQGSRLANAVGKTEFTAASWHHQAIRQIAPPLRAVAFAPDGTIEAIESAEYPWLIGVQWHPEITAANDVAQQRLFNWLVQNAKSHIRNRG